jgi:hypothetical protein
VFFSAVARPSWERKMPDIKSRNVRIRGKISRKEWPKIAERFSKGETLAEIARSYQCTAPAIRYIVGRVSQRADGGNTEDDTPKSAAASSVSGRATAQLFSVEDRGQSGRRSEGPSTADTAEIWDRISSDIASFLAGMDAVSVIDSDENYQALLVATDRLLRASARTRLELERVLGSRKMGSRKKGALQR